MDQPGKVANPARGQLNRENNTPLPPCMPENLVSRDGFSRPVPRQPAHLRTQAESGAWADSYAYEKLIRKWTKFVFFVFFQSYGYENGPDSYGQIRLSFS